MEKVYVVCYDVMSSESHCVNHDEHEIIICKDLKTGLKKFKEKCLDGIEWFKDYYSDYKNDEDYSIYDTPSSLKKEISEKIKNNDYNFTINFSNSCDEYEWLCEVELKELEVL